MKIRDIIKLLKADGWYLVATKGSHPGDDLTPGTLNSILKQAKLEKVK
jgi:predicted RNA binding protein YcfA (HicA-like mRNA interferase family)